MNLLTVALLSLRIGSTVMRAANRNDEAELFQDLGDLVVAGAVSDEQMRKVADLLADRKATSEDLRAVLEEIKAERGRLHAP